MARGAQRAEVLVFDVNETLLDLRALAPLFAEHLGSAALLKDWFHNMLLYSQTVTLAGPYADFSSLARASLQMAARTHGRELTESAAQAIFDALRSVPVHPDVPGALRRLQEAGFRLAALTNSTQSAVDGQLEGNGLSKVFDMILSVDEWKLFKPHLEIYRNAAAKLGVEPEKMRMIAAHPWDLMGARAAGCQVAFVERTPGSWFPLVPRPEIGGPTLKEVADQLIG